MKILLIDETTKFLCDEIQGCKFGFCQSDEISLLLTDFDTITTQAWFDGQVQKIVSVSAAMGSVKFNSIIKEILLDDIGDYIYDRDTMAVFDARVFTIPDRIEVENYFVWRQKDAMRNAISMHAQSLYSSKQLHKKSQIDMKQMILDSGEDHDKMHAGFRLGRSFTGIDLHPETDIYPKGFSLMHYNFSTERDKLSQNIPEYET